MEPVLITPKELGIPETLPLPKRKDWRIGIIGFGGIAQGSHAPSYKSVGWPIVAVADPNPEARKIAKEKFGIENTYADYKELLADDSIEIIDLCTQPTLREEVVCAAAEAGKHIIIEKPLAASIKECERMVKAADRAGVKLAVHQNYRWFKSAFLAHHIIERGFIGEPFLASIEIFGCQDTELAGHPFYSKCEDFLTVQWDNHLADLLRYWTGKAPERIFARTGRMKGQNFIGDNMLMVITDFGEGVTGHILHHELLHSSLGGLNCRIDGSKGSILFQLWGELQMESELLGEGVRKLDTTGLNYQQSWCGTMGDLLISIEENREPLVSGRRNLTTIKTILAEDESARAGGKWIDLD